MDKKIRVMIVDDHEMLRNGLAGFIRSFDDLEIIGEAKNGRDAVNLCAELEPDVVLMDLIMPEMDGIEATRNILSQYPHIKVIALTSSDDKTTISAALQAGFTSYVLKNISNEELAQAIRAAYRGKRTLSPEITESLIEAATHDPQPSYHLSDRELEVLRLMGNGLNNNEIAEELIISRSTVKFHVSGILAKMGVKNRIEAVRLAIEQGLL